MCSLMSALWTCKHFFNWPSIEEVMAILVRWVHNGAKWAHIMHGLKGLKPSMLTTCKQHWNKTRPNMFVINTKHFSEFYSNTQTKTHGHHASTFPVELHGAHSPHHLPIVATITTTCLSHYNTTHHDVCSIYSYSTMVPWMEHMCLGFGGALTS